MTTNANGSQDEKIVVHVDRDLEDLIPNFMTNRQNDLIAMRDAVDKADYETIRGLAHCIKGAGGGYGFDGISEIAADLELAAKAQDSAAISTRLESLADYLQKVEIVYE
jgi:HPt (histidine-containing phosphotransfer) domain-containing protein